MSETVGRVAVGTNRVWISDDLGNVRENTWRTIGFPDGVGVDARPKGSDPVSLQNHGVPGFPGVTEPSPVIQLRWSNARELLALFTHGLVRYTQDANTKEWTTAVLIPGPSGGPAVDTTLYTDVCPVPGTSDFYLTTTGDTANPPSDTCWFFDSTTSTIHATGLRGALDEPGMPPLAGPLDPAYAVAVDPTAPTEVYVGTVTGVWRGTRDAGATTHRDWTPFVNGLPQATVQDLSFWTDPNTPGAGPHLLRASIQSRGVWEVDLAADEAQRTYIRVHLQDDRRRLPTPMANPRRSPTAIARPVFASPDVTVRRAANPDVAPGWRPGAAGTLSINNSPRYELWTFQTAFRWIYPSIVAHGLWSDQLGDLVELHRSVLAMPINRTIDRALWNAVVGATRLDAAGRVSTAPGDPLAVYRTPWHSPLSLDTVATEIDLMELVVPVGELANVWKVYAEPSTVDVLIHHRDTRPVPAGEAFVTLLWRSAASQVDLLATPATDLVAYAQSLLTATPAEAPAGWNVVPLPDGAAGPPLHRSRVPIDARMPRAVPIDVDFSQVTPFHRVLLLALVGSTVDGYAVVPVGAPATVSDLVRAWPYAAMRLVRAFTRPP